MESQPLVKQPILKTTRIIFDYIVSDINKNPRSFKIGLFTIYLVVTFLALIQSAFQLSPLIFIQLAEQSAGDTDITLAPTAASNRTQKQDRFGPTANVSVYGQELNQFEDLTLVNCSQVEEYLDEDSVFGQSPRWILVGNLSSPVQRDSINDQVRAFVILVDSLQEISIGMGRRLDTDIISNNQAMVTSSALRGLNLTKGDRINLNLDIVNLLGTFASLEDGSSSSKDLILKQLDILVNQQLIAIYGPDIIDKEFQTADVQAAAKELQTQADYLETHPIEKALARSSVHIYINNQNISQTQKNTLNNYTDIVFERNFSSDAQRISNFANNLPNDNITIREVEDSFADIVTEGLDFNITLVVQQEVSAPKGKWADGLGNVIALDYMNVTNIFIEGFIASLNQAVIDAKKENGTAAAVAELIDVNAVDQYLHQQTDDLVLSEYALTSNLVVKDRVNIYSSKNSIQNSMIDISNIFFSASGYQFPVQAAITLGTTVQQYLLMKNFIDNLIISAVFLLLMLSMLLIYSLMIGDVEDKTYEFGMLRALGFQKRHLIILLFIQACTFALPGLALGLITAYILNSLVAMFIFDSSDLISSYQLHPSAIGLAFGLGIIMPLLSNILPIMRALSKTLRDSLDLYHRSVNEITVTVVKLENLGVSLSQSFTALLLVVMGFVSYYLIPMAFIFSNIQLALAVINIILIVMIIGFTLLVNLLEPYLESLILRLILCFRPGDRNLKPVIDKNMQGHYNRNWKTTLMYTIALAFLIFAGAGFTLQTQVITDVLQSALGADMTVLVLPADKLGLDEFQIRQFMNQTMKDDPSLIQDFSFSTYLFGQLPQLPSSCWISTLAQFPWKKVKVAGVEQNMLNSVLDQFYLPDAYDSSIDFPNIPRTNKKDGVAGLYNRTGNIDLGFYQDSKNIQTNSMSRGAYYKDLNITKPKSDYYDREINILMPQGYKYEASISVDAPCILYIGNAFFRLKVRHMATKLPGFLFSAYRGITAGGQAVVSMPDALYMLNDYYGSDILKGKFPNPIVADYFAQLPSNLSYGLPKDQMFIQFARSTTKNERTDFANGLRNYFRNQYTLLFDTIQLKIDAEDTFQYIQLFYVIVAIVAMVLSFFLILVSFVSNVKENSWEFGVLRAIGLDKEQITRVYVYESISLIMASGLLGMHQINHRHYCGNGCSSDIDIANSDVHRVTFPLCFPYLDILDHVRRRLLHSSHWFLFGCKRNPRQEHLNYSQGTIMNQQSIQDVYLVFDVDVNEGPKSLKEFKEKYESLGGRCCLEKLVHRAQVKFYVNENPRVKSTKTKELSEIEQLLLKYSNGNENDVSVRELQSIRSLFLNVIVIDRTTTDELTERLSICISNDSKNVAILEEVRQWMLARELLTKKEFDTLILNYQLQGLDSIITNSQSGTVSELMTFVELAILQKKKADKQICLFRAKENNQIKSETAGIKNMYQLMWLSMLTQIPGINENKARAVVNKYPSLQSLLSAYKQTELIQRPSMLSEIPVTVGVMQQTGKKLGEKLSQLIYEVFHCRDHERKLLN